MRARIALAAASLAAACAAATADAGTDPATRGQVAAAPRVRLMVAGRTRVLLAPRTVTARQATIAVPGRGRCAVAQGTALAALDAARRARLLTYRLRDEGSCSRSVNDGGSLFVTRVDSDTNAGRDGWVYKVGRRTGTTGAGDPTGPFGGGRIRSGAEVLWFYCRLSRVDHCQRSLEVAAPSRVARGAAVRVRVRGYDDNGHGIAAAGAVVRLGSARGVTGADGYATVVAPQAAGTEALNATRAGMVPAFPRRVRVG
jgi:hypothetical protein